MKPRSVPPLTQADIDRPNFIPEVGRHLPREAKCGYCGSYMDGQSWNNYPGFAVHTDREDCRKPVLAVYGPQRTYWPFVFWFVWCCAITALACWLVR